MTDYTARLNLPQLIVNQANKETTVNESLAILDALVQCAAISETNTPPGAPVTGDIYLIGTSPSGTWATHAEAVAYYDGSSWDYHAAREGFIVYDRNASAYKVYSAGSWTTLLSVSGAATFTGLSDVPGSYTGYGEYLLRVNAGETALEFVQATNGGAGDLTVADTQTVNLTYGGSPATLTADVVQNHLVEDVTPASSPYVITMIVTGLDLLATVSDVDGAVYVNDPVGTPADGTRITLRIKSSAVCALTFGLIYRDSADLALPTATSGGNLTDYFLFIYNGLDDTWDYLAQNAGF